MMNTALNLAPQNPLWHYAQLFFYTSVLRGLYSGDANYLSGTLGSAGDCTIYKTTLPLSAAVPSWVVADYGNWQLVVIEGTTGGVTDNQWLGNIYGVAQTPWAPYPGRVNTFFSATAGLVAINMKAVLGDNWPLLNAVLVGHSLGGAVAQLIAYDLHTALPNSARMVTTFGSPRVGDVAFSLGAGWPVLRVENRGDPVPLLPPTRGWTVSLISDLTSWGPCQDYVGAGEGWVLETNGEMNPAIVAPLSGPDLGLIAGWEQQGFSVNALPHSQGNYAQRVGFGVPKSRLYTTVLGIDLALVNHYQMLGVAFDDFNWTNL